MINCDKIVKILLHPGVLNFGFLFFQKQNKLKVWKYSSSLVTGL